MTSAETPRLADRLSALVGQAGARANQPEDGGAAQQLTEVSERLAELRTSLPQQLVELRDRLDELQRGAATSEGDTAALATGIVSLGDRLTGVEDSLAATAAELATANAQLAAGQEAAAQSELRLTARMDALAQLVVQRVDEAALALAETFLGLLGGTSSPAAPPVGLPSGPDQSVTPAALEAASFAPENVDVLTDTTEIELELEAQGLGTEEGGALPAPDERDEQREPPASAPGGGPEPALAGGEAEGGRKRGGIFRR